MTTTEKLILNLKEKPEIVEKLKKYDYKGKKQFRIDFSEYVSIKINWTDVISDQLKKMLKEI